MPDDDHLGARDAGSTYAVFPQLNLLSLLFSPSVMAPTPESCLDCLSSPLTTLANGAVAAVRGLASCSFRSSVLSMAAAVELV
jgi:hypothetical protein